jgi:DNA-binding transcriptional MerR regulator
MSDMKRVAKMTDNAFFTVNEFAKLARTTRNTLHHYDAIGLFFPSSRGADNNYRYYSIGQLAVVNVIRTLQALGMSLVEIKNLTDRHTPERMDEVLAQQIDKINEKIDEWVRAQKLLFTLRETIHSVHPGEKTKADGMVLWFRSTANIAFWATTKTECRGVVSYSLLD